MINKNGLKTSQEFTKKVSENSPLSPVVKSLLKEKAPRYTEIEVSFFQLCDLHCRFCWQDNYDPTGTTSIREKADTVIDYLKENEKFLQPRIQVHLLGGELFEDNNNYYNDYEYFILKIQEYCKQNLPDKELIFVFLTNMNFQKESTKEKVEKFLQNLEERYCDFILTTSWDPTGRPLSGETTTRFHHNITYFKKYLSEITFVLTKNTIKQILKDRNSYLDYLYSNGFTIDYDYYMPTKRVDSLMPSDWDLLNAIRFLLTKYPNIPKLKAFTKKHDNPGKLTCASLNKITILPDGTITNCRHLNYEQEEFDTKIDKESNASMIMNFITKKECLSCEYFRDCPMSCFLMSDHKKFIESSELDDCLYKLIFQERDERKNPQRY